MNSNEFKNIVGQAIEGETATIRFFGKITQESTQVFNTEFEYLETIVRPKLIRVLINSEGGSVLYGMSTYSTLQNSTIPTECIIEGMAASMASILWAGGTRSLMRDYSILMIHNPFLPSSEPTKVSDLVLAFTNQIKTIYRKRFGLKKEHIESIMNGEAGRDGTYFDADSAVHNGIIPRDNILHTSKQLCDKVKCELENIDDVAEIELIMSRIHLEADVLAAENKHFNAVNPTLKQIPIKNNPMNDGIKISPEYSAVAATLGMKENYEVKDVMARISELMHVEAKLKESERKLTDAHTVIAGKEATISNLQKDNTEKTAFLKEYQKKEADEKRNRIEQLIVAAIDDGKIDKTTKTEWVEMAQSNFTLAENTLNSIPARDQITKAISTDPSNIKAAKEATKSIENELTAKVTAVVGEGFEFQSLK